MSFGEFLAALFQALDKEGVRYCVLRNYEDFPINNKGRDVDFLINTFDLPGVSRALFSIKGIRIVGYSERHYVASFFLAGVCTSPQARALQIDFDLSLTWKGMLYLSADAVLGAMIPRPAGNSTFFVPSSVHEAIISLLSSLLIGGWLNDKYLPQIRHTLTDNRSEVIASLSPQFGLNTATRLVDSVTSGDRARILGCVQSLRVSLALHNLLHRPVHSALAIVRHYGGELAIRYSPKTLHSVCIFGLDVSDNTMIIDTLMPLLQSMAVVVEKRRLRPAVSLGRQSCDIFPCTDFFDDAPRSWLTSMAYTIMLLINTWVTQLAEKRNLTLRIYDGCHHELSFNPKEYGYGGPEWFARLIGKLFPSPDLWILLDAPALALQSSSQKFYSTETLRQREAYLSFVKTRKRYIILDVRKPTAGIAEEAYAAIIDTLALCTNRQLKNRF
ncbi:MAG: hypothetical protein ACLPXT_15930 [Terracidiphilus sp.]